MAETFHWNEATLYLMTGGAGASAANTFGKNVTLDVEHKIRKTLSTHTGAPASRTRFDLTERDVQLSVGSLFADQSAYQMMLSATAFDARLVFKVTGGLTQTGEFRLWSAVFTHWGVRGNDGGVYETNLKMQAADISGVW
jgi:hypothetical protein